MNPITIDQKPAEYVPGSLISGFVNVNQIRSGDTEFEVRLIWYTEGKGDRDLKVVASLPKAMVVENERFRFEFTAPTRPFSFSGRLVSLLWAVEIVLLPSQFEHRAGITLSNTGEEIILDKTFEDDSKINAPISFTR